MDANETDHALRAQYQIIQEQRKRISELEAENAKLKGINAKRVIKLIEAICETCGHNTTEDGCPHCIKARVKELEGERDIYKSAFVDLNDRRAYVSDMWGDCVICDFDQGVESNHGDNCSVAKAQAALKV